MTGEPYFLVSAVPPPGEFTLDGAEGRHAATVRRMRPGQCLVLTDGVGSRAMATVHAVGRGELSVLVGDSVVEPPPQLRVVLVQALPKGEHSDLAIDLATQAGVDEVVPWQASRCVAQWAGDKSRRGVERWAGVAVQAAKQARRVRVPSVGELVGTAGVVELIARSAGALVLHEAGAEPIRSVRLPASGDLVLVVGPEGGVSAEELAAFCAAGAQPARLSRQVLRTSSAAAVALGALGVLTDRWT